jgi:hypothetical protein
MEADAGQQRANIAVRLQSGIDLASDALQMLTIRRRVDQLEVNTLAFAIQAVVEEQAPTGCTD